MSSERDALIGRCLLQNVHESPGSHMVGYSVRAPKTSGDCTVNDITLAFSPESARSPSGRNGTSEPCLDNSRIQSPPHCTSFLPFSPGRDPHPPPILPRLPPKTEGDGHVSFISLSSNGLASRSCSSRDMRVGLLKQPQLSTSSSTSSTSTSSATSSSSSFSSSPSLSSVSLVKPSLEVQSIRCPITVGGPSSHCNLHQHSSSPLSSSLSLFAAKESTNFVALQQIDHPSSSPCAASEECTDNDEHQYNSSSCSSGSCNSTQMSVFYTKPPNGYSHNGHPPSRDPSSSFSLTSSSPPTSTCPTAVRSKGTAFRQPPIAVTCHSFADLVLLKEREAQHICSDGSSVKVQTLRPLQAQANRSRILDPDIPLMRLGRSSGVPRTTGVVHESRSHTLPNVGGDMLNLLQTSSGASTVRSDCTHNSVAVPTLTFGSFQHRSGNYLLTGSDDEDSSDDSHGNGNSLKPVQQPFRHCMGIHRPLRGSFLKIKHLKNLPPSLPPTTKVRTQSVVGHSSVIHTSCSKGDGRVTLGCDNAATDGMKEERAACETSYQFENGSDAKQLKQGKYRFPDPFENADIKFCKRVSHFKSLVTQTIRWEQNRRMKKH